MNVLKRAQKACMAPISLCQGTPAGNQIETLQFAGVNMHEILASRLLRILSMLPQEPKPEIYWNWRLKIKRTILFLLYRWNICLVSPALPRVTSRGFSGKGIAQNVLQCKMDVKGLPGHHLSFRLVHQKHCTHPWTRSTRSKKADEEHFFYLRWPSKRKFSVPRHSHNWATLNRNHNFPADPAIWPSSDRVFKEAGPCASRLGGLFPTPSHHLTRKYHLSCNIFDNLDQAEFPTSERFARAWNYLPVMHEQKK